MLRHVAVVPSTPLVLPEWPGRAHPVVQDVAAHTARAVDGVGADVDLVVLLAGGDRPAVHVDLSDPALLDLRGYGAQLLPHALGAAPPDAEAQLSAVWGEPAAGAGTPRAPRGTGRGGPAGAVSPDLVVLARLLPAGTPAVGLVIPPVLAGTEVEALAAALLDLTATRTLAIVTAGDLGAGFGPKPPRPAAAAASAVLQDLAVAALDGGAPAALVRLDPDVAAGSASRAVGALRVLGAVLDAARVATVVRTAAAPLGVGYVVARGG